MEKKKKDFLKNTCINTRDDKHKYVPYDEWDDKTTMMTELKSLGYKFSMSMIHSSELIKDNI